MGKITDLGIRNLIKAGERFDGHSDGDGLYLRYRIERDIKPSISKLTGGEVRQKHSNAKLKSIVARGAPTMATDVMRWTKRMFDYAVKREMVPYNPAAFDPSDADGREESRTSLGGEHAGAWPARGQCMCKCFRGLLQFPQRSGVRDGQKHFPDMRWVVGQGGLPAAGREGRDVVVLVDGEIRCWTSTRLV